MEVLIAITIQYFSTIFFNNFFKKSQKSIEIIENANEKTNEKIKNRVI